MPDLTRFPAARPPWATELHPAFCARPDGCDGHHLSEVAEVETGGIGPVLLAATAMDRTGRCTVSLTVDDPDPRGGREIPLTVDAAETLAYALLAQVAVARTQAHMVPAGVLAVAA